MKHYIIAAIMAFIFAIPSYGQIQLSEKDATDFNANSVVNPKKSRRAPTQAAIVEDPEVLPEFVGGDDELFRYLSQNLKYPQVCVDKKKEGTVMVHFIVDNYGTVCAVSVAKGVCPELDEEAVRVVKSMPKWKPGSDKGRLVSTNMTLPVTFQLKKK